MSFSEIAGHLELKIARRGKSMLFGLKTKVLVIVKQVELPVETKTI